MNIHKNARTTPHNRAEMVCRVLAGQNPAAIRAPRIAAELAIAKATAARILKTAGLVRLKTLEPPEPVRRYARLTAKAPHGRWRPLTFLAALRTDCIDAPCVVDGPIDGASFLACVEQILAPPPSSPATSSPWTTWAATRVKPCAKPSALSAPSSSFCPL